MKPSALLLVVAIVVVPGAPVFAKDQYSAAKSKQLGYASAPMDRSEALRTCNAEAAISVHESAYAPKLTLLFALQMSAFGVKWTCCHSIIWSAEADQRNKAGP